VTDISDLREGDEIEMVIKAKLVGDGTWMTTSGRHPRWFGEELFPEIAERITVVRPEIIPGKPYVDAEGKLYVGKTDGRLVYVNDDGTGIYFHDCGHPGHRPLPAGLRPAMIVPEPATHDGPRRTVDAPAVHGGGRVVAD
jgi:hypothetical protein